VCTMTHSHPGPYGAPTGAKLRYRILADCAIRDGAVYDEWLVRDQSAIVTQMGHDPKDWTRAQIAREGGAEACVAPMTPANDVAGPYTRRGNDNDWCARYAAVITGLMLAEMDLIPQAYDRAANLHYAGGQDAFGWQGADQFWMGLRAAFPTATFTIDHVIGREDALLPPRAALRWSLHGKHSGWGRFGAPTGAEVYIMGMCHAEFGPYGQTGNSAIRREFALIDETAIWRQILLATGDHA
jgi:predicted ester cyclase